MWLHYTINQYDTVFAYEQNIPHGYLEHLIIYIYVYIYRSTWHNLLYNVATLYNKSINMTLLPHMSKISHMDI